MNDEIYLSKKEILLAIVEKGQSSRRYKLGQTWELNFSEIREAIATIHAADVVEVVRCRDCQNLSSCRTSTVWAVPPGDDWFCADGKRREQNELMGSVL